MLKTHIYICPFQFSIQSYPNHEDTLLRLNQEIYSEYPRLFVEDESKYKFEMEYAKYGRSKAKKRK